MFKKILCVLFCITLIFSMSACSKDTETNGDSSNSATAETTDVQEKTEENQNSPATAMYKMLGEGTIGMKFIRYSLSEKSADFMNKHPEFFPGSADNMGAMYDHGDQYADYPHIAKSPSKYQDKLIGFTGTIIDCKEIESEQGIITFLQVYEDYSEYNYCMYYLGELPDIVAEDHVEVVMLPFDIITFDNLGGYTTEALMGAACSVVGNYDDYSEDSYEDYSDDDYEY